MSASSRTRFRLRGPAALAGLLWLSAPAGAEQAAADLCLYRGYTDELVARYSMTDTDRFALSFLHSVSLTPVTDLYRIEGGAIRQTAEIFETHGAGLPSFAGDVGQTGWRREDGRFVIEMDRRFDRIQLRVSPDYRNRLAIADRDIDLAALPDSALGLAPCASQGH